MSMTLLRSDWTVCVTLFQPLQGTQVHTQVTLLSGQCGRSKVVSWAWSPSKFHLQRRVTPLNTC